MDDSEIKRLPISEFRERGYLHEVNRLVLHPLGLALEVNLWTEPGRQLTLTETDVQEILEALSSDTPPMQSPTLKKLINTIDAAPRREAGHEALGGVWDYRDDPEGVTYGGDLFSPEKAERVCAELLERREERKKHTGGWVIQPIPDRQVLSTTYTDPELRTSGGELVVEPGKFAGVEMPEGE